MFYAPARTWNHRKVQSGTLNFRLIATPSLLYLRFSSGRSPMVLLCIWMSFGIIRPPETVTLTAFSPTGEVDGYVVFRYAVFSPPAVYAENSTPFQRHFNDRVFQLRRCANINFKLYTESRYPAYARRIDFSFMMVIRFAVVPGVCFQL